ncbi:MAG TPA: MBOAT family protein [Fluviicola sp.]|nr:MBOAT family protein [Fluviicola sp.]
MLFSSLVFLFYFLPATLLVYYLAPKAARNAVLLLISLLFYMWGGTGFTLLLLTSILGNFILAKLIERSELHAKKWLITGIIVNVALLFCYKYLDFFIQAFTPGPVPELTPEQKELARVVLPVGISFYTFHQLSMLRDIYRDRTLPKVSIVNMSLYVALFPQLVAGPIVRYKDIIYQIHGRRETIDMLYRGVQRFLIGLFKKVIIANTCASLADTIMEQDVSSISAGAAWLGITAYTLQIYFDFSGYSDMAIGLGRLFGFNLPENFNLPYIATSIKEFWRRWHISLSTWFRDYVYIPLGGSKKGPVRTYVNLMLVFLLTGFWHGASWSFLFWGFFHGVFLLIERLGFDKVLDKLPRFVGWSYTMLVVMIGWVFFRIEAFGDAALYVERMFSFSATYQRGALYFLDYELIATLIPAIVLSTYSFRFFKEQPLMARITQSGVFELAKNTVYLGLFVYCVVALTSSSYNPFIYFNF